MHTRAPEKNNATVSEKTGKTRVSIQSCLLHQPAVRLERDVAEKELPSKVGICRRWAQVKYSTHSTICICSLSSFLPSTHSRILQWTVLLSWVRIRPSSDNFKSQRCAMNFLLVLHRVNRQREALNLNLRLTWQT